MDELQLEELQRSNQQTQDGIPHDPNAASRFTEGYTPVGLGEDNTPVEQVNPIRVPEIEVTSPILDDIIPQDVYGSSGDSIAFGDRNNPEVENTRIDSTTPLRNANVDTNNLPGIDSIPANPVENTGPRIQEPVVVPPAELPVTPPIEIPVDPLVPSDPSVGPTNPEVPNPPVDPEDPEPPVDPPVDPEEPEEPDPEPPLPPVDPEDPEPPVEPPVDPPVDPEEPEEPDPEDPEEPEEPDPEDPEEPEEPDPEDPEDPENPGGGNPGNDKEVGNSPWDGETGASDNPGKGNHQDGQDPEPNQPPGDSKNDGGPNNDSKDPPGNGGDNGNDRGKPENHQDNGWGNGDDDAPGGSLNHNNAENDQSPSGHYDDFVSRFIEENPVDLNDINTHEIPNEHSTDNFDTHIPDVVLDNLPEVHFDHFDHPMDHFDHGPHSM